VAKARRQPIGAQLARALAAAAIVLACTAAAVLAAGPRAGASYSGHTAHGYRPLTLTVSRTGRSVVVNVPFPPLYCQGGGGLERQITHPATITANAFHGSITYEYRLNHRLTARLRFNGRFSGAGVRGTVRSEYFRAHRCDGSTTYTARAR
jgi:hypothetical protein